MPATGVQNSSHFGASVTFTMPFTFLFEEYADMIYVYGFCDGNSVLAVAEYQTLRSPPLASQVSRLKPTGLLCVGMDERTSLQ